MLWLCSLYLAPLRIAQALFEQLRCAQGRARYRQLEELAHLDELALKLDSHVSGLSNRSHGKHHLLLEVCGLLLILLNGTKRLSNDAPQEAGDRVESDGIMAQHGSSPSWLRALLGSRATTMARPHIATTAFRRIFQVRESMGNFILRTPYG